MHVNLAAEYIGSLTSNQPTEYGGGKSIYGARGQGAGRRERESISGRGAVSRLHDHSVRACARGRSNPVPKQDDVGGDLDGVEGGGDPKVVAAAADLFDVVGARRLDRDVRGVRQADGDPVYAIEKKVTVSK